MQPFGSEQRRDIKLLSLNRITHCSVGGKRILGRKLQQEARQKWGELHWYVVMWQVLHFWVYCEVRVKGLADRWDVGCVRKTAFEDDS